MASITWVFTDASTALRSDTEVGKNGDALHIAVIGSGGAAMAAALKAVEAGDMKKAQQMVDEAAKDAGYNLTPLYHKTWSDFTKFIPGGKDAERQTWYNKDRQRTMVGPSGRAIWLSMDKEDTPAYHNAKKKGERLLKLYAKMQVPLIMDADTHDWAVDVFADGVKDFPLLVTEEARKEVLEGGHDSIHFFGLLTLPINILS